MNPLFLCDRSISNLLCLQQYLKDRKKGKYSMISGKKIKMKVKKSKEDKKVIQCFHRHGCSHLLFPFKGY